MLPPGLTESSKESCKSPHDCVESTIETCHKKLVLMKEAFPNQASMISLGVSERRGVKSRRLSAERRLRVAERRWPNFLMKYKDSYLGENESQSPRND